MSFKKYYAVLSGEHRTLPLSELRAVAYAEGVEYREVANLDMVAILESTDELPKYITRSALTKVFGEVIAVSESDVGLTNVVKDVDWNSLLVDGSSYTLSLIRIKEYSKWVDYESVVNAVKPLTNKKFIPYSKAVRAEAPLSAVDFILSDGLLIIGRRHYEREPMVFRSKDPKYRPAYRPGTMKSIMSRVLVNLSRVGVRSKGLYLDPFCGVGGLLIEACAIGIKYLGSDIDGRCVDGARKNLKHFNCIPSVITADACKLPYRYVDGVGTDPPYGRLTRSKGCRSVQELMECSINRLADVIRRGGYLAIAQSKEVSLDDILVNAGFKVVEKHYNWLHRSLVRNIYVAVRV